MKTTNIAVVLDHPHGRVEVDLEQWVETGPAERPFLRPVAAIDKMTGEHLPLSVIPMRYRNNAMSRLLVAVGVMKRPWPKK